MTEHSEFQINKINRELLSRGLKTDDVVIFYEIWDRLQGGAGIVSTKQLASNIKISEDRIIKSISRLVKTNILSTERMSDPKSQDRYIRRYIKILWNPYLNNKRDYKTNASTYTVVLIYLAEQSKVAFVKCLKNIVYQVECIDNSCVIFSLKPGMKFKFSADVCLKNIEEKVLSNPRNIEILSVN